MEVETVGGRGASYFKQKFISYFSSRQKRGVEHPVDIKKYQDWSLEKIEGHIRQLDHEELFALDANDKPIAVYKGTKTQVAFPISLLNEEGATVTHGHPKGAAEFGGTFSFADVYNMAESKWKEHRATASGQGEMNYIMKRNSKSNTKRDRALISRIQKDEKKVMGSASDAYSKKYKEAIQSGKTQKQAIHLARQEAVGEIDKYWANTLPKYGIDYIKRKKNYKYGR